MKEEYHLGPIIDIISLIAIIGVAAFGGLLTYRSWDSIVSLIGTTYSIILVIMCVILLLCFIYLTVTNLMRALFLKRNDRKHKEKEQ